MLEATLLGQDLSPGVLAVSRRSGEASSSRLRPPNGTRMVTPSNQQDGSDEELAWTGGTLVWSRGCEIYRQYTFELDREDIAYALFTPFRCGEESHQLNLPSSNGKGKEKETILDDDTGAGFDTFGSFHTAHRPRSRTETSDEINDSKLQRTLTVFMQTKAYILFPSGERMVVRLPFRVERAWPIPSGGVIVQRMLEGKELRRTKANKSSLFRDMDVGNASVLDALCDVEEEEDSPLLWTLERPFEDFKVITDASADAMLLSPTARLIYVATDSCPIVVVHDSALQRITFYRQQHIDTPPDPKLSPVLPPHMSPRDTFRQQDTTMRKGRPSLTRTASTFGPTTGDDRVVSGRTDPLERTTRRGPRSSRGSILETDPAPATAAGELHATLDPPPFAMTVNKPPVNGRARNVSGASSIAADQNERRASSAFLREEMPVADNRAIYAIAEKDLKETTMVMGLDNREEVPTSSIAFARLHSWRCPPVTDDGPIMVFESDNFWPNSIDINIRVASQLYTFRVDSRSASQLRKTECLAAVPVISTRHAIADSLLLSADGNMSLVTSQGQSIPVGLPVTHGDGRDEVARRMASSLSMQINGDDSMGGRIDGQRIVGLEHPTGSRVTLVYEDGESVRVSVDFMVKDRLVRQCLEAASYALSPSSFFILKRELLGRLCEAPAADSRGAWNIFSESVRLLLGFNRDRSSASAFGQLIAVAKTGRHLLARKLAAKCDRGQGSRIASGSTNQLLYGEKLDPAEAPSLLLALHLVAQDCRCIADRQADIILLAPLLQELAGHLGLVNWWDYWERLVPRTSSSSPTKSDTEYPVLSGYELPPDIIQHLTHALLNRCRPFPTLMAMPHQQSELGKLDLFPQLRLLCDIYDRMSYCYKRPVLARAHETALWMAQNGVTTDWIRSLSFGIAMPIWEMIRICQNFPPLDCSPAEYDFMLRPDLAAKARGTVDYEDDFPAIEDEWPTIGELMKRSAMTSKTAVPLQPSLQYTRFGQDRRVAEVERIMEIYNVRTVHVPDPEGASEQDIVLFHQSVVNVLSNRTLSATVGGGILDYGRRRTAVIDPIRIPMIELSVKVVPGNSLVKAQINAENADWPCFHNGVSAALALSRDCKGITSAWIHSNRPSILNPEHGGFLLGLGLNGHLRTISSIHVLNYLEPRHDYVSSGLLLGWAGSFAGSRDELCTKVFSLHTHALLPLGSAELNASPIVQCSALVGLGLVHAGSRDLRMAEVTLSEVGRRRLAGLDTFEEYQEAYSFSASMAFGLIMLGRGGQQASDVDRRLLAKLRRCIIGESVEGHQAPNAIDTTITAPGATLALGLMYLKTGDREACDILEIPQTAFDADHVRPDFLLLRVLARSLIMWDEINPSTTWIEAQLPPFIRAAREAQTKHVRMTITSELAYFYMVAGACLAIGLKYAGTASELAHNNLIIVFSELSKAASASSFAYEFQIRRHAARQCLNVVTLALAAVMSGTGELHVMRRLRVSHGQEGNGVTYGTHMANHMATGLLFLGRGHYTLGSSNLAIASLCISFFPRFQPNPSDNKAYPQSFRHLWALAVEPRCLVAKDVDTKRTVYLPINIKVKEGDQIRSQMLISPTLVTPFTSVVSIEVDSPRYWPITYDLSNPRDRDSLVKTRTMHVKRKAAFLDYKDDPKGHRSMLTRAGSMTGWDLYHDLLSPAAPPTVSAAELESLVIAHAPLPDLVAMSRLHAGDSAFDVFVRNVILECVSMDKVHLVHVYISMWLALHGQEALRIEHIAQFTMLETFYSPSVYQNFMILSTSADRKQGWIRPSFLQLATRRIQDTNKENKDLSDYFNHEISSSAVGVYLARNNVPSLEFLRAIRQLVAKSRETPIEVLEIRVRDAARTYAQGLQRQYDPVDVVRTVDVKVWKMESIREVIRLWLESSTE